MSPRLAAALLGLAAAVAGPALAQGSRAQGDVPRGEREACLARPAGESRAACLREMAAARAEARRGRLSNGVEEEQRQRNALLRCQRLPADERGACERRMSGEGTTTGSVESGGVYRELVVRSVGEPAGTAPSGAVGSSGTGTAVPGTSPAVAGQSQASSPPSSSASASISTR